MSEITANSGIEELNLRVRTYNILYKKGINDVGTLLQYSKFDLGRIIGMGDTLIRNVVDTLAFHGLKLKGDDTVLKSPDPVSRVIVVNDQQTCVTRVFQIPEEYSPQAYIEIIRQELKANCYWYRDVRVYLSDVFAEFDVRKYTY